MMSANTVTASPASATMASAVVTFAMLTFVMRTAHRLRPFARHDGRGFYNTVSW